VSKVIRDPSIAKYFKDADDFQKQKSRESGLPYGSGAPTDTPLGVDQYWDTSGKKHYVYDETNGWTQVGPTTLPPTEITFSTTGVDITVNATTEVSSATLLCSTTFTADGTSSYVIEFYCFRIFIGVAAPATQVMLHLWDGTTELGRLTTVGYGTTAMPVGNYPGGTFQYRWTLPSAGSHTVSVRAHCVSGGAGAAIIGGGGGGAAPMPMMLRVTRA
jgi:hypothetical protein